MAIVHVHVSEATLHSLEERAAERGLTLNDYLHTELERLATRQANAKVVERLAQRERTSGPSTAETVAEIRRTREAS